MLRFRNLVGGYSAVYYVETINKEEVYSLCEWAHYSVRRIKLKQYDLIFIVFSFLDDGTLSLPLFSKKTFQILITPLYNNNNDNTSQ